MTRVFERTTSRQDNANNTILLVVGGAPPLPFRLPKAVNQNWYNELMDVASPLSLGTHALPAENSCEDDRRATASRINGAQSRGPKTDAGKHRSSANALKHGLLSKRIAPLPDFRLERQDYEHHLRELTEEYQPRTRTQLNLVELLARDWVRLARIGGVIEQLSRPDTLCHHNFFTDEQEPQLALKIVDGMRQSLARGVAFDIAQDDLAFMIQFLGYCLQNCRDEPARYRSIAPRKLGIATDAALYQVLSSPQPRPADDLAGWTALLNAADRLAEAEIRHAREEQIRHERECRDKNQPMFLQQIENILRLTEYENQIRRSINRTMEQLRESLATN